MKRLILSIFFAGLFAGTFVGCGQGDPGVTEDVPMTTEEQKENDTVGQVPGT